MWSQQFVDLILMSLFEILQPVLITFHFTDINIKLERMHKFKFVSYMNPVENHPHTICSQCQESLVHNFAASVTAITGYLNGIGDNPTSFP